MLQPKNSPGYFHQRRDQLQKNHWRDWRLSEPIMVMESPESREVMCEGRNGRGKLTFVLSTARANAPGHLSLPVANFVYSDCIFALPSESCSLRLFWTPQCMVLKYTQLSCWKKIWPESRQAVEVNKNALQLTTSILHTAVLRWVLLQALTQYIDLFGQFGLAIDYTGIY